MRQADPQILVRGLRMNPVTRQSADLGTYAAKHNLVALDPITQTPVVATWTYEGRTSGTTTSYFLDKSPTLALTVTATGYLPVTLNSARISFFPMHGQNTPAPDNDGFMAIDNGGMVSLWPTVQYIPSAADNHGVKALYSTLQAACALRDDGSIFAWGNATYGGQVSAADATRTDVLDLFMGFGGRLLASGAPYVTEWGDIETSQPVPDTVSGMSNIVKLWGGNREEPYNWSIVLNSDRQVSAWGQVPAIITVPPRINSTGDIVDITCGGYGQSYVLRANGAVDGWGFIGEPTNQIKAINDAKEILTFGTRTLFNSSGVYTPTVGNDGAIILRSNGSITGWGIVIPDDIAALTNVVNVAAASSANQTQRHDVIDHFFVLCADGSVDWFSIPVTMSTADPDDRFVPPADLSGVASLCVTAGVNSLLDCSSIAALKWDGTVVTWGSGKAADSSSVAAQLVDVVAVYPGSEAFVALKSDGTLVAWGDPDQGGDTASIPAALQGNVSFVATTQ